MVLVVLCGVLSQVVVCLGGVLVLGGVELLFSLKIGCYLMLQVGLLLVSGVVCILVIGLGKGGVGKLMLILNFVVVLVCVGWWVGLLDVDIYGFLQLWMLGLIGQCLCIDGQMIELLYVFGVMVMLIGLMMKEGEVLVWCGLMLMGVL